MIALESAIRGGQGAVRYLDGSALACGGIAGEGAVVERTHGSRAVDVKHASVLGDIAFEAAGLGLELSAVINLNRPGGVSAEIVADDSPGHLQFTPVNANRGRAGCCSDAAGETDRIERELRAGSDDYNLSVAASGEIGRVSVGVLSVETALVAALDREGDIALESRGRILRSGKRIAPLLEMDGLAFGVSGHEEQRPEVLDAHRVVPVLARKHPRALFGHVQAFLIHTGLVGILRNDFLLRNEDRLLARRC